MALGQAVPELDRADAGVFGVDGHHAILSPSCQSDKTLLLRRKLADRLDGVVQKISEQAVQVKLFHKVEGCAADITGQLDTALDTERPLVGKQYIQNLIPGICDGLIFIQLFFQFLELGRGDLTMKSLQNLFQIVVFLIDKLCVLFTGLKMNILFMKKFLHSVNILVHLSPFHNAKLKQE